jgi:hypothetical protein
MFHVARAPSTTGANNENSLIQRRKRNQIVKVSAV